MNYLEAKERERLLKKLEPRYTKAELVFLDTSLEINNWRFAPNYYLLVRNCLEDRWGIHSIIITLDPKGLVRNVNALTIQSSISRFSNWWISASDLNYMERHLKPINSFIYHRY
jgi:hypothetical protein